MEEKHEGVYRKKRHILFNNFLGGVAWGVGATVGASIVLGLLGLIVGQLNLIPYIGSFVSEVVTFVLEQNHYLRRIN